MSDSDNDLMPSNVVSFQNENTTVWARGPNINTSNLTGLSFRNNNILTSTMHLSRNIDRERFIESGFDTRRHCYRRETSPMSLYSGSDMRARNFNHSYYPRGMSSHRSVYNGRSGSPMSVRTTDSTASVSATDIAMAFKNMNFNKYDLRIIKDAYNKFMKHQVRKKIEKRRNLKLFMKGIRRRSGYDSGEQGSDSSLSSNDGATKSSVYKENMSSGRSTKTDLTDFKRTMIESSMYKDCSDNFRHSTFRNMFNVGSKSVSNVRQDMLQSSSTAVQGERFKSGFLWPSQRFNKSNTVAPIPEHVTKEQDSRNICKKTKAVGNIAHESDSDQEEIFSEVTVRETTAQNIPEPQQKRQLDSDGDNLPNRKRTKLSSPMKQSREKNNSLPKSRATHSKDNILVDFEFVKPTFPVRKSANLKTQQEKLLSKSSQPKDIADITPKNVTAHHPVITGKQKVLKNDTDINKEEEIEARVNNTDPSQTLSISDVAMRPSFIKRKLFTQKLDVTEKRNASTDSLSLNSPSGNVYNAIQKEKHKARKLVTSQSCLSRDVQDDNNLIDLIHKIVPPDRINMTQSNRSDVLSKQNKSEDDDRWDVTSVITTCNEDNVSDTYTDEEIFKADNAKDEKLTAEPLPTNIIKPKVCKIVMEKIPDQLIMHKLHNKEDMPQNRKNNKQLRHTNTGETPKSYQTCIRSFWDTDFESDMECSTAPRNKSYVNGDKIGDKPGNLSVQEEAKKQLKPKADMKNNLPIKESNKTLNNTVDHFPKINTSYLKIRSHRTPKKRKCNDQSYLDYTKTVTTQNKVSKINQPKQTLIKVTPATLINVEEKQIHGTAADHNTSRPIRSCRISKNSTINSSKLDTSTNTAVTNTSLRSNRSDMTKLSPVKNLKRVAHNKLKNKKHIPEVKSRESDVSFSLTTEIVRTLNDSQIVTRGKSKEIKTKHIDVSYSLGSNIKSPVDKKQNTKIASKVTKTVEPKKNETLSLSLRSSKKHLQTKIVASTKSRANKR